MAMARPLACGLFICIAAAFALLVWAFISNDFTVAYVVTNSNSLLPVYYRIAATWGAHEGSLLLWVLRNTHSSSDPSCAPQVAAMR